jgi:hypothetical protein
MRELIGSTLGRFRIADTISELLDRRQRVR